MTRKINIDNDLIENADVFADEKVVEEIEKFIYFDANKQAHMQPVSDCLAKDTKEKWEEFCYLTLGKDYDINEQGIVDLRQTPEYIAIKLATLKENKLAENTNKAKQAVEKGFVLFKNAQFETNSQTVGDLTATMLMLQANQTLNQVQGDSSCHAELVSASLEQSEIEGDTSASPQYDEKLTYSWLSKDDKVIELSLEDFITLGNLIAEFKNTIWSKKYLEFKEQIENAQTIEELEGIDINYGNFDL